MRTLILWLVQRRLIFWILLFGAFFLAAWVVLVAPVLDEPDPAVGALRVLDRVAGWKAALDEARPYLMVWRFTLYALLFGFWFRIFRWVFGPEKFAQMDMGVGRRARNMLIVFVVLLEISNFFVVR